MSAARKKNLNYKEFTKLIKFPLTDKMVKDVGHWLGNHANKPEFDINKLVFKVYVDQRIPAVLKELVVDSEKGYISFLPYLASEAATSIDKLLFLRMIAIIPVARLCELKEPVTPIQEKEKTLAHYAVYNEKFSKEFIKELHKKGMDVNQGTSDYGTTPAHVAGSLGRIDALEALKECKVDIYSAGRKGLTPHELAYVNGQQKAIEFLKKECSAVLNPVKLYVIYAEHGDVSALKKLKRDYNNLDVNETFGKRDQTALIVAVAQNKMEAVKYLLNEEKSTNTHRVDKTGFNALHYAVKLGNYPMVDILLKQKDSTQDIHPGMLFDAFEIAEKDKPYRFLILYELINKLADAKNADMLNFVDYATGDTLLHYAVREVKSETYINTLIKTKLIDVNKRSAPPSSLTPLEYAVKENKVRAVTSFLNINSVEINPEKLLSIAIQNNSYQVLQLLIDKNILTDLSFCLKELMKSVKTDDLMKNAIINFILKKLPPSDLAKELPEGVRIAIKADAKETAILLTDHLTKETLSEEECSKLRKTSQNNTMKLVSRQLKKIYPIAVSKVNDTIYVPAAAPSAFVDEQKDRAKRLS